MSLRLKGQETKLAFSAPDGPTTTLAKITDFEVNILGEILEENYVGEDSPDFDDIANGCEVRCTVHLNDPDVFEFFQKIEDRRRRIADAAGKFSAVAIFKFPSGRTRKGIVNDLFFGDLPVKLGSRKAYATTTLQGKAKRVRWV